MVTETRQPIVKLYKRCKRKQHARCPGSFEDWSVCSCECHAPKVSPYIANYDSAPHVTNDYCPKCGGAINYSESRGWQHDSTGAFECEESPQAAAAAAVAEAQAIVDLHADCKARGLPCGVTCSAHVTMPVNETPAAGTWARKGRTLRERCFTPCAEHAPAAPLDDDASAKRTWRMFLADSPDCKSCAACSAATLATARAFAIHEADRDAGLKLPGYRSDVTISQKDIRAWHAQPFKLASGPCWPSSLKRREYAAA